MSACQIIHQLDKYDVQSLDKIYDRISMLKLLLRVGFEKRIHWRRVYCIHNIVKHFIHEELNQSIVYEQYFKFVKIKPVAFCIECAKILEDRLYVRLKEMHHQTYLMICDCELCTFLRLGMYYTSLFEMNGHFIQWSQC